MRSFIRTITDRFSPTVSPRERALNEIHREWNRQLRSAISHSDALEIDTAFTRALDNLAA